MKRSRSARARKASMDFVLAMTVFLVAASASAWITSAYRAPAGGASVPPVCEPSAKK